MIEPFDMSEVMPDVEVFDAAADNLSGLKPGYYFGFGPVPEGDDEGRVLVGPHDSAEEASAAGEALLVSVIGILMFNISQKAPIQ